ncbi:hypothetical protein D0Y65_001228 [Glycine soja]|uniref:Uncharacterized protein n=1 Tax=Glycine soja TaxID=3848 RepID=A0A445M1U3_GLYSO|nr:hypothetical protein D0Y65_001228 [Glycine soja]
MTLVMALTTTRWMRTKWRRELDNKKDFDIKYNLFIPVVATIGTGDDNIVVAKSKSFVSMQGWDFDTIFCLVDCDFLIRKPPDPDNDVYDFREIQMFIQFPRFSLQCRRSYVDRFVVVLAVKHDYVFGDDLDLNEISYVSKVLGELNHPIVYSMSPRTSVTPAIAKDISGLVSMYRITGDE